MTSQPLHTIVTHAGAFHADEIMALVLLERFYLVRPMRVAIDWDEDAVARLVKEGKTSTNAPLIGPDGIEDHRTCCWVVRTRAPSVLEAARKNPTTFVLDVGAELDEANLNFDHHQASMTQGWPNGTPYSSTGLIWRWLRKNGQLDGMSDELADEIEQELIIPLDAHDNGVEPCREAEIVETYNRSGDTEATQIQFQKALSFLRDVFDNTHYRLQAKLVARKQLEQGWTKAQAQGEDFVILEEPTAYNRCVELLAEVSGGKAQMLGLPSKGKYNLTSLRGDDGPFSSKCPVPEQWRGRFDFDVEIDGKPISMAFAHKSGFMCVINGGAEQARMVAREVVRHNERRMTPTRRPSC